MKKALMLAIVLLNLLSLTEVSAQNYSSETGKTCTGSGILCDAMNSEADIYTVVIGESEYEFNDYSEYGDFSQEVVFSDGTSYLYGYEEYDSGNMSTSTVEYGGSGYTNVSNYDTSRLRTHDLVVLTNGNKKSTLRQVSNFMLARTEQTGNEVAAVMLSNGNFVVFKDSKNTPTSAIIYYDSSSGNSQYKYYNRKRIVEFYHTHPIIESFVDLDISNSDQKTARLLNCKYIYIVGPDGTVYIAKRENPSDYNEYLKP